MMSMYICLPYTINTENNHTQVHTHNAVTDIPGHANVLSAFLAFGYLQ